jgi:hypothetical protein
MAHAEGYLTTAYGAQSHAQNLGTIANGAAQTTMGKYNVADTTSLLIIGNGTADNARSNALTVDKVGNVLVGQSAYPTHSKHLITKEYLSDNTMRLSHTVTQCTAGSSSFTFAGKDLTQPYYLIYFNGLLLINKIHYTISNKNTVILNGWTATADDHIQIVGFLPNNLDSNL